ncbi:MAG: hypothetical protein HYV09_20165 [Deltaproteobacteria bacterium]|nr:hypothetical protein [Deltaproteobacteria bacterium]
MRVVSPVVIAFFVSVLSPLACSSASSGGSAADTGVVADASADTKGDAAKPDAAKSDAAKSDAAGDSSTAGVKCGDTVCSVGQVCCASGDADAGFTTTCAATCPSGSVTLACDGPEDCKTDAPICCAEVDTEGTSPACTFSKGISECRTACAGSIPEGGCPGRATVRPCHKPADCTDPKYPYCCEFSRGGTSATFCANDLMKFVADGCF